MNHAHQTHQTALVTGAYRGIGRELTRQLAARGWRVVAVHRRPADPAGGPLRALGALELPEVDVRRPAGLLAAVRALGVERLDLLINNAGVFLNEALGAIDYDDVLTQLEVNAVAPLRVTEELLPLLGAGSKVVQVTSRMGSIADNTSGAYYGYRMSKAALNAASASLALDLRPRGVAVALVHPGFVRTEMTGGRGLIEPEESARGILARADALTLAESGGFWHVDGSRLPW